MIPNCAPFFSGSIPGPRKGCTKKLSSSLMRSVLAQFTVFTGMARNSNTPFAIDLCSTCYGDSELEASKHMPTYIIGLHDTLHPLKPQGTKQPARYGWLPNPSTSNCLDSTHTMSYYPPGHSEPRRPTTTAECCQ